MAELEPVNANLRSRHTCPSRQLAPFLLSLLLHIAVLIFFHSVAKNSSVILQHPMEVYLSVPAVIEPIHVLKNKLPTKIRIDPERISAPPTTPAIPPTEPIALPPSLAAPPRSYNSQQLIESAKNIARDAARKTEQDIAALEKKKLNTPAASLEQYLRQPHKEIRLANGMLKIITDAGAVCFQPVPYFARDAAGLFGIPTTCP